MAALQALDYATLDAVTEAVADAWRGGRRVFCLGNGGSAATASHFANDLRRATAGLVPGPIKALSLVDQVPVLTSVANDFSYDEVFVEQLRTWLEPHDIVIGFTTSGKSVNVLRALEFAVAGDALTVAFTGVGGETLRTRAAFVFRVASDDVPVVEDVCLMASHVLALATHDRCVELGERSTMAQST
jgi:D-sedoheptulose 7-phosphate isomerase